MNPHRATLSSETMRRLVVFTILLACYPANASAQEPIPEHTGSGVVEKNASEPVVRYEPLQRLKVSENRRFLVTEDGKPFFWLGDTGWAVFNRITRDEARFYFADRARKQFNVIQVFMTGWMPNTDGQSAFVDGDATQLNPAFFDHAESIIDLAAEHGLYIMLCVGEVIREKKPWMRRGSEFLIREPDRAYEYGRVLGARLGHKSNIIWNPGQDYDTHLEWEKAVVRAIANGIADGASGRNDPEGPTNHNVVFSTFHPSGSGRRAGSSAEWYHDDPWLDFNMIQSAHHRTHILKESFETIEEDYNRTPAKPVLDGEPCYENHRVLENRGTGDVFSDFDVRRVAYWNVFAGALGHTYGCSEVYSMANRPGAVRTWQEALDSKGAQQMQYLRRLIGSRPFLSRIPDQTVITSPAGEKLRHIRATRDENGTFAFIYVPDADRDFIIDLDFLSGRSWTAWWFDPRTGETEKIESSSDQGERVFVTPNSGPDWVLVIDDNEQNYDPPGVSVWSAEQ